MTDSHSDLAAHMDVLCAVITCSDTRTPETDRSGDFIRDALQTSGFPVKTHDIVPDDPSAIVEALDRLLDVDVILINGGTGIARRDNTFDAVRALIEKPMPGFGEIFRVLSFEEIGPAAMLSRATAGVMGERLVFSMPGSTGAVRLAMEKLILPDLRHLVWEIRKRQ